MDHWPAAESGFVGHGLGMEMSWAPKIKLGDVIWDTAGDLVEHNGCTFVKLSRQSINRCGFSRLCFEAFKHTHKKDEFTLGASIGYDELITMRNAKAREARYQAQVASVPELMRTLACLDQARRKAERHDKEISYQIMIGPIVIDVLDPRKASDDLVIKCEFRQIRRVVDHIIQKGMNMYHERRLYNKHAKGSYTRADGRQYTKSGKSRKTSDDGQAQSAEDSSPEKVGQGEAEDEAEAEEAGSIPGGDAGAVYM